MFLTDDPLMDFEHHDWEQAKQLAKLPECDYCNDPIQDDFYYEINGEIICEHCLDHFFRKDVEDYVR